MKNEFKFESSGMLLYEIVWDTYHFTRNRISSPNMLAQILL